ncbi:hypothetical protein OG394_02185 [Kribbella sp. NBC_01245]|uniref:nickel/cobalt transporter n=1 Tax=Kribbella sp. NBC_01245 TaxID=2903578 RepID=UPI002E2E7EE9|nr:hypothetical protein [Kribbella sp. NBC_01245]
MPSRPGATADVRTLGSWLRALSLVALVCLGSAAVATEAAAHPFGPPPVAKVVADGNRVAVTWSAADDDLVALGIGTGVLPRGSGNVDDLARRVSVAQAAVGYLGKHVAVAQGNQACTLAGVTAAALWEDGARLEFNCPAVVTGVSLRITALTDIDAAYRTVSVSTSGSGALHTATAPTQTIDLGLALAGKAAGETAARGSAWTTDLPALLDGRAALPLMLLVSALVGAAHACAPGHGKTLAAGYLVGGHGRARDAVWLGLVVAVMHTLSVSVLGVGFWILADTAPDLAAVTGWLQLAGSLLVVAVGLTLIRRHLRNRQPNHRHAPDPGHGHGPDHRQGHGHGPDHGHAHGHGPDQGQGHGHGQGQGHGPDHGHGHGHGHVVLEPEALLTRRGIVLLGTSGGLLPSPSAFLVLVAGLLTGRVGTAVLMVIAFGIGMALTLSSVGLAVLRGRDALLRRAATSTRLHRMSLRLPLAAAGLVVTGGSIATVFAAVRVITT